MHGDHTHITLESPVESPIEKIKKIKGTYEKTQQTSFTNPWTASLLGSSDMEICDNTHGRAGCIVKKTMNTLITQIICFMKYPTI
jgi:hypothetical protein